MYKNGINLLLATVALVGCAPCPIQTFTKIVPVNQSNGVRAYKERPYTVFEVEPDVTIRVRNCRGNVLCVTIILPRGRRMQLSEDEFKVLEAGSGKVIQIYKAKSIYYQMSCEKRGEKERTCSSSELSPTNNLVEEKITLNYRSSKWESPLYELTIYEKSFSSTLEFVGVRDISSDFGYRKYELSILMDKQPDSQPYIVMFPLIIIDGNSYKLPEIWVAEVSEPMCTYRPW